MDEIVNKVAKSGLVNIDLEKWYPTDKRVLFDLKDWLFEELILKEKDFRENLKNHDWTQYENCLVAINCTVDAIVPSWAYMLITTYLQPIAKKVVFGDFHEMDLILYHDIIENLDIEPYVDQRIIIKGCSHKPVPENAYIELINRLQPIAKSLMFGEACSTVPLYKKK